MRGYPVGDGIGWHAGFVHVQEGEALAVRRPEVVAAHSQFFCVNPVHLAVQKIAVFLFVVFVFVLIVFLASQLLFGIAWERAHVQIVFAHVGQAGTVGRKLGVTIGIGR